jgi:hypothetical protein
VWNEAVTTGTSCLHCRSVNSRRPLCVSRIKFLANMSKLFPRLILILLVLYQVWELTSAELNRKSDTGADYLYDDEDYSDDVDDEKDEDGFDFKEVSKS